MCYILGVCLSNQPTNFLLYGLTGTTLKQFTVMVARGRKAAQIDPSYSPFGADVHPYLTDGSYGLREFKRKKSKSKRSIAVSDSPHRYGNSHATWDHTVLPATRQRRHSRRYPSRSWYSIKRPWRDARLS